MNRRDILFICFCVLLIVSNVWMMLDVRQEKDNFQKIIDTQENMLYNKDMKIEELQSMIFKRDEKIVELQQELESRNKSRKITCETSAYTSGDGMTPSHVMANGEVAHVGAVACNFLPMGTQVKINGNTYTVKDRCGIDDCIDIYMSSHAECIEWGRRTVEVEIL